MLTNRKFQILILFTVCYEIWEFITSIAKSFKFQAKELGIGISTSFLDKQGIGHAYHLIIDTYHIRCALQNIFSRVIKDFKEKYLLMKKIDLEVDNDAFGLEVSIESNYEKEEIKSDFVLYNLGTVSDRFVYHSPYQCDANKSMDFLKENQVPMMFRIRLISNDRRYGIVVEIFFFSFFIVSAIFNCIRNEVNC